MHQGIRIPLRGAKIMTAAVVAMSVAVVTFASGVSAAAAAAPADGGVYTLASGSSGKCVVVSGSSADNGAPLVQTACSSSALGQQFKAVARGGCSSRGDGGLRPAAGPGRASRHRHLRGMCGIDVYTTLTAERGS